MIQRETGNGLTLFEFERLGGNGDLVATVAARLGGVSPAPFSSLNGSYRVGDGTDNVVANRKIICKGLGVSADNLVASWQTHGDRAAIVTASHRGRGAFGMHDALPDADILLTNEPDVLLIMTFADCVPIVLHDPINKAVCLAHAGWRGTMAGVAAKAVDHMRRTFGSNPAELFAGIGPSIGPCCFEVGDEVIEQARTAHVHDVALAPGKRDKPHVDLWAANLHFLRAAGVPSEHVEVAGMCTSCRTDAFFSHRKENGATGRFAVVVGLKRDLEDAPCR